MYKTILYSHMSYYYKTTVDLKDIMNSINTNTIGTSYTGLGITVNNSYVSDFTSTVVETPSNTSYLYQTTDIATYCIAKSDVYTISNTITIPSWCNKIRAVLVGTGGTGGSGGASIYQYENHQHYHNNVIYNNNNDNDVYYYGVGYGGGGAGGGGFSFISSLTVTPSSSVSLTIDSISTRLVVGGTTYSGSKGFNGGAADHTAVGYGGSGGSGTTSGGNNGSSGSAQSGGSGANSGVYNSTQTTTYRQYGNGGRGGNGGAAQAQQPSNNGVKAGQGGTVGSGGFCKIYYLVE